ncbi:unnamed protein product [Cylindrotheca closterium]|uniref:DUF6816 domain-containing protein n=1 Tax=Cylindrotheca closterium TaxID=2856 RepID=A0AAD2CPJ0_9STRA|nr:unnamed protein product [Cylindrotheca closterium]
MTFAILPAFASTLSLLSVDRRSVLGTATTAALWISSCSKGVAAPSIQSKISESILTLPPPSYSTEFKGNDITLFPSFLEGEWQTIQTLVSTTTPLGLKYLGGPNGDLSIAEKTMEQSKSQIDKPVKLKLRYLPTRWGVAEDRLFNTRQRLNAFAGKDVVASVQYADVGGSNRKSVLLLGGTEEDPLQTTMVYFKGPAAQKSFVVAHGNESLGDRKWVVYELQRSIFALTNQNTAPPVTTDTEYIWKFEVIDDSHVEGTLRIAAYLNAQNDKLYFEARNRAVSLQDYSLKMERLS